MGFFAGLTASAFRQEGDDIYLLAPGKPRRYLSYDDYERARGRLETMYMVGLPLIVVLVGVGRQLGYIWPIAGGLLMIAWLCTFGLRMLKQNTVTDDAEGGVDERVEPIAVEKSRSAGIAKIAIAAIILVGLMVSFAPLLIGNWSGQQGSDVAAADSEGATSAQTNTIDSELDRACLVIEYMRTIIPIGGDYTVGQVTNEMLRGSKTGTARWEKAQDSYIWHLEKFDPLTKRTSRLAVQFEPDTSSVGQSVKAGANYCGPLVLRASRGVFDGQELDGHPIAEAIQSAVKTLNEAGGASGSSSATIEPMDDTEIGTSDGSAVTIPADYHGSWAPSFAECQSNNRIEVNQHEIFVDGGPADADNVEARPGGHAIIATHGGGHGPTETFTFRRRDRAMEMTIVEEDGSVKNATLYPCQ